jgi:chromate reductase
MISIVVGTNRKNSTSKRIAILYKNMLAGRQVDAHIISMEDLPHDFAFSALYEHNGKNEAFNALTDILKLSKKVVFIVPEYNNSFPGVLKTFLDGMEYPNPLRGKWGALVGLSSGVQGAGLALSHLTDILHYLGMNVLATKPRLARIEANFKEESLSNPLYSQLLEQQITELIKIE